MRRYQSQQGQCTRELLFKNFVMLNLTRDFLFLCHVIHPQVQYTPRQTLLKLSLGYCAILASNHVPTYLTQYLDMFMFQIIKALNLIGVYRVLVT